LGYLHLAVDDQIEAIGVLTFGNDRRPGRGADVRYPACQSLQRRHVQTGEQGDIAQDRQFSGWTQFHVEPTEPTQQGQAAQPDQPAERRQCAAHAALLMGVQSDRSGVGHISEA